MNSSPNTTPPFLRTISYPGGGATSSDPQSCIFPVQPLRDLMYFRNVRQCSYFPNTSGSPITINKLCARETATDMESTHQPFVKHVGGKHKRLTVQTLTVH